MRSPGHEPIKPRLKLGRAGAGETTEPGTFSLTTDVPGNMPGGQWRALGFRPQGAGSLPAARPQAGLEEGQWLGLEEGRGQARCSPSLGVGRARDVRLRGKGSCDSRVSQDGRMRISPRAAPVLGAPGGRPPAGTWRGAPVCHQTATWASWRILPFFCPW